MKMKEDIYNLKEILQLQHKYKPCGSYVVESQKQEPLYATPKQILLFQSSTSPVEQTIATYKQTAGTISSHPPPPPLDR